VLAVELVVVVEGVDVVVGLEASRRQEVVERGELLVEGEVKPRDVGGDDDVGQLTTGECRVELLGDLFVVLPPSISDTVKPGLAFWKASMSLVSVSLEVPGWLLQNWIGPPAPPPLAVGELPLPAQAANPAATPAAPASPRNPRRVRSFMCRASRWKGLFSLDRGRGRTS
jgi:hypothetical protein